MNQIEENAEKRKNILRELDENAITMSNLAQRNHMLQREFRQLELDDRRERLKLEEVKVPTGIIK